MGGRSVEPKELPKGERVKIPKRKYKKMKAGVCPKF